MFIDGRRISKVLNFDVWLLLFILVLLDAQQATLNTIQSALFTRADKRCFRVGRFESGNFTALGRLLNLLIALRIAPIRPLGEHLHLFLLHCGRRPDGALMSLKAAKRGVPGEVRYTILVR